MKQKTPPHKQLTPVTMEDAKRNQMNIIQSCIMGVSILLATISINLLILIQTQYIHHRIGQELFPNDTMAPADNNTHKACNIDRQSIAFQHSVIVQKAASKFLLINQMLSQMPAIATCIAIAALSDRFGRRPMLILNFGCGLLRLALSCYGIYSNINLKYFYVFNFIDALGGGFFGRLSVSFAFVADLSKTGSRTIMITILEIVFGTGFIIGSLISGYIIEDLGFFYSSIIILSFEAMGLIVLVLFIKESLPKLKEKSTPILHNIKNAFTFYTHDTSEEAKRWKYIVCLLVYMFGCFGMMGKVEVEQLYQLNIPFCWPSKKIGLFATVYAATRIFAGMGTIKLAKKFMSDSFLVLVSMVSNIGYCVMEAFAKSDVAMFMAPVLGVYSAVFFPLVRAIMSKMTPPDRQGALFGGISVAETACSLAAGVSYKAIYASTVGHFGGTIFLVMAVTSGVALGFMIIYRLGSGNSKVGDITESIYPEKTNGTVNETFRKSSTQL